MKRISDIKINIDKYPREIINTLNKASYDAYIVGGCVRDAILGKIPSDYDITTNASPFEVKKLFKRTIDTGLKHGTVTVLFYENDKPYTYEVTTFRKDGDYEDMRHPKNVEFVNELSEDLLRRDFTVNAMAYNDNTGLIDLFGGLVDLEKKLIRAVGNPVDRFNEDALRLLRAVRFAAKLGFNIESETLNAIPSLAKNLLAVSKERVQVELTKTLTSDNPDFVELIFSLGLAQYVCEGLEKVNIGKFKKNLSTHMAYSCLFYNVSADDAVKMLKELKLDNNTITAVFLLLKSKVYIEKFSSFYIKDKVAFNTMLKWLINEIGYNLIDDFIMLLEINEKYQFISYMKDLVSSYKETNTPIFVSDLAINGNDVMAIGFKGQEIGLVLYYILRIVHKNKAYNEKKLLQDIAKKAYNMCKGAYYEL